MYSPWSLSKKWLRKFVRLLFIFWMRWHWLSLVMYNTVQFMVIFVWMLCTVQDPKSLMFAVACFLLDVVINDAVIFAWTSVKLKADCNLGWVYFYIMPHCFLLQFFFSAAVDCFPYFSKRLDILL